MQYLKYLKFKFIWEPCIFICSIQQPYRELETGSWEAGAEGQRPS